jgi:hypothetical protein
MKAYLVTQETQYSSSADKIFLFRRSAERYIDGSEGYDITPVTIFVSWRLALFKERIIGKYLRLMIRLCS